MNASDSTWNSFSSITRLPLNLAQARLYAIHFAKLAKRGEIIGDRDLQIAATALSLDYRLATLNVREFQRIDGLTLVDVTSYGIA